jgi:hypothetical protein
MIRRWSYLNFIGSISQKIVSKVKRKTKLNLFKANLKFKRFRKLKLKFTKIRRKSFKRLKHRTSLIFISNVFKFWSSDYQIIKNLIKFEFLHNFFEFNYIVYNYNYIQNNNELVFSNTDLYMSASTQLSRQISNNFAGASHSSLFYFKTPAVAFAWFFEKPETETTLYVPLATTYDTGAYLPIFDEEDGSNTLAHSFDFNEQMFTFFNFYSLRWLALLYDLYLTLIFV